MLPPLQTIPPELASLADYETAARARLTGQAWSYIAGGAADGVTLRENRDAYDRLRLRGRVLADFSAEGGGHARTTLFGRVFEHPILLAPVAYQRLAHPEGERAVALAAAATGATFVVSTQASVSIEEIAAAAPGAPRWFQLYMQPDRDFTAALVRRAEAAGCEALVVTADAPVNGVRNAEQRARFALPPGVTAAHLAGMRPASASSDPTSRAGALSGGLLATAPTWADLAWLRSITRLPILLKGVTDAADSVRALDLGMDGLVISNHGGRTLDTLPATIDVLPEIARAVGGRAPVLVDGGIRRGTDVLKALALGASAVLIGRPYVFGLATAGAPGVAHVVRLLRAELEIAMALTGCPTLASIGRDVLWREGAR
jgi:4-hydroxymandelate oxidase